MISFRKYQRDVIVGAAAFAVGIFIDRLIKNVPLLSFDGEINVLDLANLVITIGIAILIPVSVSKILEDQRGIKSCVIDDLKDLLNVVRKVKKNITHAYTSGAISDTEKDAIYDAFYEAELKTSSIQEQLKESFPVQAIIFNADLQQALFDCDRAITGGRLAQSRFTSIDDQFYRESGTAYSKFETSIKIVIHKVHKA